MPDLPAALATYTGAGYIEAPAGFGKTHLIAQASALCTGRQLILTHTYAGVSALRKKMRALSVSPSLYRIDTIASWSLRLCLAYRRTSGWSIERPTEASQWISLYESTKILLSTPFIERIIRASYTGVIVDEYQDSSASQHEIVARLAQLLPCRILGDPLQGIFDFGSDSMIDWSNAVLPTFERIGELVTPHRWRISNSLALGEWLRRSRTKLARNEPLDLTDSRPPGLRVVFASDSDELRRIQISTCHNLRAGRDESVVAIHAGEYKARCHTLARALGGRYTSIEEIEGKDLFAFVRRFHHAESAEARLEASIVFAKKCLTRVEQSLPAATKRLERVTVRSTTRNPRIAHAANALLDRPRSIELRVLLLELRALEGVITARSDLFSRALGVLKKHELHPHLTLEEAADIYQMEFRHKGRPLARRKIIGTTLLVKGLEYDHAIVLDAESLPRNELYVALTRGSKSLTIISTSKELQPST